MPFRDRAPAFFGLNSPSEFCSHAFEASSADPEVNTLLPFAVVSVPIAPALFMCLLPLGKAFAVVTYAGKTEPAVIMSPALVWTIPLLPDEHGVTPESELILPVLRNFLEFSQIAHQWPPVVLSKCTTAPSESPPTRALLRSNGRVGDHTTTVRRGSADCRGFVVSEWPWPLGAYDRLIGVNVSQITLGKSSDILPECKVIGDLQKGSVGLHLLLLVRAAHHFHHQI